LPVGNAAIIFSAAFALARDLQFNRCMMSRGYFLVRRINETRQKLERRKNDGNQ